MGQPRQGQRRARTVPQPRRGAPYAPARGARPKRLHARLADGREDARLPARPQVVVLWRAGDMRDDVSSVIGIHHSRALPYTNSVHSLRLLPFLR